MCYSYFVPSPEDSALAEVSESAPPRPDRRARRRQETIEEILTISREIMTTEGVNGLSLAEVARRLGVQPPSLYKYFPSLMAVYDALFLSGQRENLEAIGQGMATAEPGLDALIAGLEASGRWCLANRAVRGAALLAACSELPPFTRSICGQHADGRPPTSGAGRRR